jgi:DUF4097 and DUF4098 domain-containing protein YvlB
MRPRGSVAGPLFIIALGVIFLLHAILPRFELVDWLGQYWPYLLILWGVVALAEVCIRALRGAPLPRNGISGGAWFVVVLICLVGFTFFEIRQPDNWWQNTDWGRGFDSAFGQEHQYSVNTTQKQVGEKPHIIIEDFRGDAKIVGIGGRDLTVSGQKTVRALEQRAADRTDAATPVEVVVEGANVIVRCNQSRAGYRTSITTNLDLSIPKEASLEVDNTAGDLEISSLVGEVKLRSGSSGMRLQNIGGNITVETRRSDLVRCTNVKGNIDLHGHGSDVELNRVAGKVSINGDYTGTISLRSLDNAVRLRNSRTDLQVEHIPGEIRLDRGSMNIQDAVGPLRVNAHSTDLSLENVTNAVEISVDRGDIDLKPGRLPLSRMTAHASSGNIELALPATASFALTANTERGQVENDFGDELKEQTSERGARLEGSIGSGPSIDLVTGRGTITVRKDSGAAPTTVAILR